MTHYPESLIKRESVVPPLYEQPISKRRVTDVLSQLILNQVEGVKFQ